jgi:thiosulfate dehydrogenase (quinone) large subunit
VSVTADVRSDVTATVPSWGLALLRVTIAAVWFHEAWWKFPPRFDIFRGWVERPLDFPVFGPWTWFVETVVLPNFVLFAWATYFTEAALAGFLAVGLLTRLWAAVGIVQSLAIYWSASNYFVVAEDGTQLAEWDFAYIMMIGIHAALLLTAAGRHVGLDGVLRPHWLRSRARLARLLGWLS